MLLSIALIVLAGMIAGWLCKKIHFPELVGMVAAGIVLGPFVLDVIDTSILDISAELRKIALIIILTRAGLSLNIFELKKVGRPALLMSFVPACMEIVGMVILGPVLLKLNIMESAVIGAVLAAVSPAVVVPKMLKLLEEKYGTNKGIPQMILAAASVDDIVCITIFTMAVRMLQGNDVSAVSLLSIPCSLILGILAGLVCGLGLQLFFTVMHVRDTVKLLIMLAVSFILVTVEDKLNIPFASLISIMCMGIVINWKKPVVAKRLSVKFNKLWVAAQVVLFVLVGALVNPQYVKKAGVNTVIIIFLVLIFRMAGVFFSLIRTKLNKKERFFCMISYTPKATVQAAMGGIPLALGLSCGNMCLTVSVLAIIITAPLGSFLIEATYKKLLQKE